MLRKSLLVLLVLIFGLNSISLGSDSNSRGYKEFARRKLRPKISEDGNTKEFKFPLTRPQRSLYV